MRPIALIAMLLAWLVYGTLAAWAGCPLCATQIAHGTTETAMSGEHHGHHGTESAAAKPKSGPTDPCPTDPCLAGGSAHMTNCAACLALPPALARDASFLRQVYPAPEAGSALADLRPEPLAPPPRSL